MTTMDYLPSDLEHMNTNFLDMIESDANSQLFDVDNLNSDNLNDILSGDLLHESSQVDFDNENISETNWLQSFQWNDICKVPQSLIDASGVENNNPNMMVNPQSVLPMHSTQLVRNNNSMQHLNHINARHGIAVKINGQDAVLAPAHHGQIQYVTVENIVSLNNQQIGYTIQPITICPQQVTNIGTITSSPSITSPVIVEHLQNSIVNNIRHISNKNKVIMQPKLQEKVYPKPVYSYSCLIAMALKNSRTGNLPVSEIYNFMIDNFPYFKTAPDGWKNSVRHNLSLNKCFAKVDNGKTNGTHTRKGCLWALNPSKVEKMEDEIVKWRKKDPESVKLSMSKPENLELIEQGKAGPSYEADEPSSPVKQEPFVHVTPVKHRFQVPPQSPLQINDAQSKTCIHDVAMPVNTEPEIDITTVKDVNPFEPAFPNIVMQNDLWEDELTIGVGYPTSQTTVCSSPIMFPNLHSTAQYHGNIMYTCTSPQMANLTPTKMYSQTPTKLHQQTPPSKMVLA